MSDKVFRSIGSQLQMIRGRAPEDSEIGSWFRDLSDRLGSIQIKRLEAAFTEAREDAAERRARGRFGQVGIDDVARCYRKAKADPEDIPSDPYCVHDCDRGELYMIDRDDYTVLGPCSCQAGEYLRSTRTIYKGKHNADELLRFGWTMKPRAPRMSDEDFNYLMARSQEIGIAWAMRELRDGYRVEPSDESKAAAAKLLAESQARR